MKKIISALSAIAILAGAVSCSAKKTESGVSSEPEIAIPAAEVTQTMYREELITMPEDHSSFEHFEYVSELEKYYVIYRDLSGNIRLNCLNADLVSENVKTLNNAIDGASYLYDISPDGSIAQLRMICDYKWGDTYDERDYLENAHFTFVLAIYDSSGDLVSETPLADMPEYFDKSASYPARLVRLSENEFAADISTALIKLDTAGNITEAMENDGIYSFIGTDSEGALISADYTGISFYGNTLEAPERVDFPDELKCSGAVRKGVNGYRAFAKMNDGYYGITHGNEFVKIIDFGESNIIPSEVADICMGSFGQLIMYSMPQNSLPYISKLTVRPDGYTENKETVVVAAFDNFEQGTKQIFTSFNKHNDDYKIEEKVYRSTDDLQLDVVSGNSPDVLVYREGAVMYRYASKGLLDDLSEVTDKEGAKISDIMCDNVRKAFDLNGKIYGLCTRYSVPLVTADSSIFGAEYTDWSYEQMCGSSDKIPAEAYFANITGDRLFSEFSAFNPYEWVDYEKCECDFQADTFVNFLSFCKNAPLPVSAENKLNSIADKTAAVDIQTVGSMQDIENYLKPYSMELDDITLVGFPSESGRRYIAPDHIYSVIANGKCRDGAREFIGYLMSREVQESSNDIFYGRFTARRDSADRIKNIYKANNDSREGLVDPVTEYLEKCDTLTRHDSFVSFIMQEEYSAFANDEITAEECAERIQDRVSIYLSEQS